MNIYRCFDSGKIEELGHYNESSLASLLSDAIKSLGENDFGVGINRSEKDFVEIRPVGKDQFMLWSDKLIKNGSFFSKLFQPRNIQLTLTGEQQAIEAMMFYAANTREKFEKKYS